MSETPDPIELQIAKQQTERERLRLDRAKLGWSRNAVLVKLWLVLAAIDIASIIMFDQSAAGNASLGLIVFGAIATLVLIGLL